MRGTARGSRRRAVDILVVCTGNICRSPYVAAILEDALPDLRVSSAGTSAAVGMGPVPPVLAAMDELELPTPTAGRQLRRSMIRHSELVLTMTHAHRATLATLAPRAAGRTYTLKELARVAADFESSTVDTGARLSKLIAHAAQETARTERDHDDDLADPYGGPLEGYTQMMREADAAMDVIIAALGGRHAR